MPALRIGRDMNFSSWCIGAGAVRNLVWDHLHHYEQPSYLSDIDLVYFDAEENLSIEQQHQKRITEKSPDFSWEITNQAFVHLWFEQYFGHPVAPLHSLQDAISTWPEYATSVGVFLTPEDQLEIIAPYGLDDLFAMQIRRNPKRVSVETYRQRILSKCYNQRWPKVKVFPE
ncbi:nucleotidyltransferase family protein [Acinetobacter qingfengensis]|nr:nucleotidyltransferase family protein [Acinetobacter qingfengensis]